MQNTNWQYMLCWMEKNFSVSVGNGLCTMCQKEAQYYSLPSQCLPNILENSHHSYHWPSCWDLMKISSRASGEYQTKTVLDNDRLVLAFPKLEAPNVLVIVSNITKQNIRIKTPTI